MIRFKDKQNVLMTVDIHQNILTIELIEADTHDLLRITLAGKDFIKLKKYFNESIGTDEGKLWQLFISAITAMMNLKVGMNVLNTKNFVGMIMTNIDLSLLPEGDKINYQKKFDLFTSNIQKLINLNEMFDFERSPNKNFINTINAQLKENKEKLDNLMIEIETKIEILKNKRGKNAKWYFRCTGSARKKLSNVY